MRTAGLAGVGSARVPKGGVRPAKHSSLAALALPCLSLPPPHPPRHPWCSCAGNTATATCAACTGNSWTSKAEGSNIASADCDVCRAGYGDDNGNAPIVCNICPANKYNAGDASTCSSCDGTATVAARGSTTKDACLPPWSSLDPNVNFLDLPTGHFTATGSVDSESECQDVCTDDCMFYSWDAATEMCNTITQDGNGDSKIGFQNSDRFFTIWNWASLDKGAIGHEITLDTGDAKTARDSAHTVEACAAACDLVAECSVFVLETVSGETPTYTCLLKEATQHATNYVTKLRAVGDRMNVVPPAGGNADTTTRPWTAPLYT